MRRALAAGVSDAGISSFANLIIGLYAARRLDPVTLGVYALLYSGLYFASVAPATAVFTPIEVELVSKPPERQLATLPFSLMRCLPVSALTAVTVAGVVAVATFGTHPRPALCLTAAAAATISPLQDHTRRLMHQVSHSRAAAAMSLLNLTVVLVVTDAGFRQKIPDAWVPLGALFFGNLTSLTLGLLLARRWSPGASRVQLQMGQVLRAGIWLLAGGLVISGPGLFGGLVLNAFHQTSEVGLAEAGRVLSQPMSVVALGLGAVLRPRILVAVQSGDLRELTRLNRLLHGMLLAVGGLLVIGVGFAWPLSPIPRAFPLAYRHPGLVAVWVVAGFLGFLTMSPQWQLTAVGRVRAVWRASLVGGVLQMTVVTLTAPWLKAYALPVAAGAAGVAMAAAALWEIRRGSRAPFDGQPIPAIEEVGEATPLELEPTVGPALQ